MSIKVRYFASLKEASGCSEEVVEFSEGLTAGDVWRLCMAGKPLPDHVLVAINMSYADGSHVVRDGDEVAFFPPVTGGGA